MNKLEYLKYVRDSTPQTSDFINRWNIVYDHFNCEICDDDKRIRLTEVSVTSLPKVVYGGSYTCCVNLSSSDEIYDLKELRIHVCDLLPIVIGTKLDLKIRRERENVSLVEKRGCVYMLNCFWCFSNFLTTNSQVCHQYRRKHSSTDSSSVRLYIYDKSGKRNMLFTKNNQLHLRDKNKQEVALIDSTGKYIYAKNSNDRTTVEKFAKEAIKTYPYEIHDKKIFFALCHDYMIKGVGDSSVETETENDIANWRPPASNRDIDHIDNKRIASVPYLYTNLLFSLERDIRREVVENMLKIKIERRNDAISKNDSFINEESTIFLFKEKSHFRETLRSIVTQYVQAAHRANLLNFVSRRTTIRRDWGESMKRQLKNEIRQRVVKSGVKTHIESTVSSSFCKNEPSTRTRCNKLKNIDGYAYRNVKRSRDCLIKGIVIRSSDEKKSVRCWLRYPDIVSSDSNDVPQQFYCAKIHSDIEYDYELVKRMRVVNQNAMRCLQMPRGFERFFSYFNIGNIGSAGRVMSKCHSMRESFFVNTQHAVRTAVTFVKTFIETIERFDFTRECNEESCLVIFMINEMPIERTNISIYCVKKIMRLFFLTMKYSHDMFTMDVISPHPIKRKRIYTNIRVCNGQPLCPMHIDNTNEIMRDSKEFAIKCETCFAIKLVSHSLTFKMSERDFEYINEILFNLNISEKYRCRKHILCNRREIQLREWLLNETNESTPRPLLHEIACHGLLSIGRYSRVTDISKTIVSINAHRRALSLVRDSNVVLRQFFELERNCKINIVRHTSKKNVLSHNSSSPLSSVKLFFAFGDFNMLNCEDGYVLDKSIQLVTDAMYCRRLVLNGTGFISFTPLMRIEVNEFRRS